MRTGPLFTSLLFVAIACSGGPGLQDPPAPTSGAGPSAAELPHGIPGFAPGSLSRQRRLEARFLTVPASDSAAANARRLARTPHMAGTAAQAALADSLAGALEALGFEVEIERFRIHLPHPRTVRLTVTAPERRELDLREDLRRRSVGERRDRIAASDSLYAVGWNAYAASGTVEAPVVHVGRGLPEDYGELRRRGVDVEGRIALARYGGAYRGVKARQAERHGAAGLVLYTHPGDGGHAVGDTLPRGPHRPAGSLQRGTVAYLDVHPGDPLTPGWPANAEGDTARRIEPANATNLPSLPVLPVSWSTARRLLGTEDAGPGPLPRLRLRMEVELDRELRTIRNVIARLPGREDRQVILGNHYDAWVFGGVDPHAGTAALLEVARGLGALVRDGWRPRREIVLAFWDAEEFGAAGSTEFVEARLPELRERAVAYLNVDMFTAGTLDVAGSPSLRDLVLSAANDVEDPVTGDPLSRGWADRQEGASPRLAPLGAGSDWTAFFHHAGVPSLQWTMNGRGHYGVYHSSLDDFAYQATFADSAFLHTPAVARVMGLAALRLAEADALPFRYARYADRIAEHLERLLSREEPEPEAHGGRAGRRTARDALRAARRKLRARIGELRAAAVATGERQARALAAGDTAALREIDRRLLAVERAFLDPEGLPERPWYRHRIYAADTRTGYGSLPLPGIAEALRDGDPDALERAARELDEALGRAAAALAPPR